jgi:cytochrome c oxidase cbb3-type subunit III
MNFARAIFVGAVFAAAFVASGCTSLPGKPTTESIPVQPNDVLNFDALYAQNCAGCHGADGKGGLAVSLADPAYLSIADDAVIRKVTANGVAGTAMPAFAQSSGGLLTDAQVNALVTGIRTRWGNSGAGALQNPPPYATTGAGNAANGANVFATYCGSCHAASVANAATAKASNIVNPAFLALVSDQDLRTTVIAGRPDLGSPNFCGDVAGKCMTPQEVTDVVAWLASHRTDFPGQPYPNAAAGGGEKK